MVTRHGATPPRLLPFGEAAILAEIDSLDDVLALHARLAATRPAGVRDLVPAARTVLVSVDPAILPLARARAWIADAGTDAAVPAARPLVEVPIVYDGEDLDEAASVLGVTAAELAARHAACEWTVAFTGFAPGFGYLVSPEWTFDVPRRASPRTRVPAGAVGLAGEFTGAYPRATPGGWQLIGTTSATLFDPDAAVPALLAPGARVRFVPATGRSGSAASGAAPVVAPGATRSAPDADPARPQQDTETAGETRGLGAQMQSREPVVSARRAATSGETPALEVLAPGPQATVQDLGRPGRLAEGIALSGAADRGALRLANRLVGNAEDAAGIEIALGGFRAVARRDLWFATAGAWGPIRLGGRAVDPYTATRWPADEVLEVDWSAHGARTVLAVRGGIDATAVAGSRATDTLAGLGSATLRAGDVLALAGAAVSPVPIDDLHPWSPPRDDMLEVEVAPGPRADWFARAAALFETVWTVSADADRVGIRLDGPPLVRRRTDELPSEGMLPGAIQVPPSGMPVILGPDGPVTGGYPVIAVVADAARDALAQARPGTRVRFRRARLAH